MYSEQYSAAPSGSGPKQRGKKSMMVSLMTMLFMRRSWVDGPQNSGASTTKNEGVYCQDVSKPPISNTLDIFGLSAKGKSRTSTLGDISDSASG